MKALDKIMLITGCPRSGSQMTADIIRLCGAFNINPLDKNPALDFRKDRKVFYLETSLCLMWHMWHRAFPDATWIIVRRADEDIIYSCQHTGFMRERKTKKGWQEWIEVHKRRFQEMHDAGLNVREVWPTKFVEGDFSEMRTIIEWLGLKWNDEAVQDFICPELFYRKGMNNGR